MPLLTELEYFSILQLHSYAAPDGAEMRAFPGTESLGTQFSTYLPPRNMVDLFLEAL